ncbi:Rod shape-determining protein MreC [hydrothermal vent metagenome]|uniref:Cell shape-determining protein MreC n=1 Tax=hydrothermal vent metagenome TaxID=652676 RepID=A0A3B0UWJ0_9ZZZZ
MLSFIKRHRIIFAAIILCLFSLHLASSSKKGTGGEVIVRGTLSVIARPVQGLFLGIHRVVAGSWQDYIYLVNLKEDNRKLQSTIFELLEKNNRLTEELKLNARLKGLLEFKERERTKIVAAEILGLSNSVLGGGWTRTMIINKGTRDSVRVDMPVVSPTGVVGRIINSNRFTSTVLLITDPRSNVDATTQRSRVRGIIGGNGAKDLTLKYVRELDDVKVGDHVVTAGLGTIFPKGLLIGTVSKAEKGSDNFFKDIGVRPAASFETLEEVLIITENANRLSKFKAKDNDAHKTKDKKGAAAPEKQ